MAMWTTGLPLQSNPGAKFAYSNNGYRLAGLLVEKVAGRSYEEVVRSLLAQADVTRLIIAKSARADRRSDEAVQWLSPALDVRGLGGSFQQRPLFAIEYRRRPLGHAVKSTLEVSGDLTTWRPFAATVTEQWETTGMLRTTSTETAPEPDSAVRFVRVKVRRAPAALRPLG